MITYLSRDAKFSSDNRYRYELRRRWNLLKLDLDWIMLNPSKAGAVEDDATIRRCVRFSNAWGYGGIVVHNLFALISTDPKLLTGASYDIGVENDYYLFGPLRDRNRPIVLAWGSNGSRFLERKQAVLTMAKQTGSPLYCLGKTKEGEPKHPLRLAAWTKLEPWT